MQSPDTWVINPVGEEGFEPSCLAAPGFEPGVSALPPPALGAGRLPRRLGRDQVACQAL